MEEFEVEGTTLLSGTIQVQAHNKGEAREEAQSIASRIDPPSSLATIEAAQHRLLGCRVTDSGVLQSGGL